VLEILRRGRRWGTAALIVMVGGVFVAYIGLGGPMQCSRTAAVVQVGNTIFYQDDFQRALFDQERYLRERLGDAYDAATAEEWIRQATANALVSEAIMAEEAHRLGLAVSRDEIRKLVLADASFRGADGTFDKETYDRFISYEFGTEKDYLENIEGRLLARKLVLLLHGSAHVSEIEARDAALYAGEEIRLGYLAFDVGAGLDVAALSDEEVAAWAQSHPEAIDALYTERKGEFEQDEAVRARHVLVKLSSTATEDEEAAARARSEAVLERLRAGEDFAAVAEEISDDPGTKERGGDLGFFSRGQMTPPFEEAAFAATPGELVGPVRSDFGFHVILVEERREAGTRSLLDARDELARELLAAERAREAAREKAEELRTAVAEGSSLEDAVRDVGLTLERTGWLQRRPDGFIAGLGASLPIQDAAFALRPAAPSPNRIFEVQGKLALIQQLDRRTPEGDKLADATLVAHQRLQDAAQSQLLEEWIEKRRKTLAAADELYINLSALDKP
jgi:peptidyl-prolyl cis-trans isomerase D